MNYDVLIPLAILAVFVCAICFLLLANDDFFDLF